MRIVLLKDVKNIGRRNEVKSVKDGFARNYLFPKGLAKPATEKAVESVKAEAAASEERVRELKEALLNMQTATGKSPLPFAVKVGEKGEVFGSVRAKDIQTAIQKAYPAVGEAVRVEKDHIKELGRQSVPVDLGHGIEGEITIDVQPEEA